MDALQKKIKSLGLEEKANKCKSDKNALKTEVNKATTVAQLKTVIAKILDTLDA